ncbi:PDxFFG protein [Mycoplasmopsis gallinacea]|uniref:PDxFFG protein n=1 Tax=Mycoplasmopsis gallinacea TaxID=29556 RepID=A0A449A3T9_9BACT|nr:PDxFFG protein [Mycoplasmopsis gallinacea]VEU58888.1 Uncharacterised protein [Mycoplasmopsis gallinacea]
MRKLSLKAKVLISLGIIAAGTSATFAGMFAFANNSDEVKGSKWSNDKTRLVNRFDVIYDAQGELKPEINIVSPSKKDIVGSMSADGTQFWWNESKDQKMSFDDFYENYFKFYNDGFILEVKYGSFSFYNEYVLAVRPKQFIDFTKWFMSEVSWGPDILTLDSFRIVPGVEQNGNSITLGSHSTLHKEESEIKFFPDAFFGSLPIYNSNSGAGNATDALAYKLFEDLQDKSTIDSILKNIPLSTSIKNDSHVYQNGQKTSKLSSFRSILTPGKLTGKEFLVATMRNELKGRDESILLPLGTTEEQFNAYKTEFEKDLPNLTFDQFVQRKIADVELNGAGSSTSTGTLVLKLEKVQDSASLKNEVTIHSGFNTTHATYFNEKILREAIEKDLVHFLDFYDMNSYLNQEVFIYDNNGASPTRYFDSKIRALNEIKNFDVANEKQIKSYTLTKVSVDNKILHIVLTNAQGREYHDYFDAQNLSDSEFRRFEEFKDALAYGGAISPITLSYSPEDISIVDENGTPIRGLSSRKYQLYNETYAGLIDRVTQKYPYLLKEQFGPYIEKKLNDKGYYEYALKEGRHLALSDKDRIGLPLVLSVSIDNFEGISTDFLKYVAAHEYGHHFTLEKGQALDRENNGVVVGGIRTRGGVSESSYYSNFALKNYLDARTNLEYRRVNVKGEPNDRGSFIQFRYIKNDGTKSEWESYSDIWGAATNPADVLDVVRNKQRRFLQDFKGMQEAAKLRDVKLGDLFIANSFDENSGTLNPYIVGTPKAWLKENEDSEVKYTEINAEKIFNEIRDGEGNPLSYTKNENGTIQFSFFEYAQEPDYANDQKAIISKVKLVKKDGTPFINVPLNVELEEAEWNYISDQVHLVEAALESLVNHNFYDSGWNTGSTFIGGELNSQFTNLFGGSDMNWYFEAAKARKNANEKNPATNLITHEGDDARKAFQYFAVNKDASIDQFMVAVVNSFLTSFRETDVTAQNNTLLARNIYFGAGYNPILSFVDQENNFVSKYSIPTGANSTFLANNKKIDGLILSGFNLPYMRSRFTSLAKGESFLKENLNTDLNFSLSPANQIYAAIGLLSFVDDTWHNQDQAAEYVYGNANKTTFALFNENNEVVLPRDIFTVQRMNTFKGGLVKKLGYNAYYASTQKAFNSIHNAVLDDFKVTYTLNDQEYTTAAFSSVPALFEFGSLDYSQATPVRKVLVNDQGAEQVIYEFNWNVDYVKTKFNLERFKEGLLTEATDETRENINQIANDEQLLANELIKRFRNSDLFLMVKDFNPATDLVANQAIFSNEYGISQLNPVFAENFVFENLENKIGKFTPSDLQEYFHKMFEKKEEGLSAYADTYDLYTFMGNHLAWDNRGIYTTEGYQLDPLEYGFLRIFYSEFSNGVPSSDVSDYNFTRTEPLLNDKFTDYIYSISETLTRDFVQTTFIPASTDFNNLPSYFSNVNEANTGFDYIIDASKLQYWNERKNTNTDISEGIRAAEEALIWKDNISYLISEFVDNAYKTSLLGNQNRKIIKERQGVEADLELLNASDWQDKLQQKIDSINSQIETINQNEELSQEQKDAQIQPLQEQLNKYTEFKALDVEDKTAKVEELKTKIKTLNDQTNENAKAINQILKPRSEKFIKFKDEKFKPWLNSNIFFDDGSRTSSYFGKFITKSNGFFKDEFEKATIGMQLYNENREAIVDETIRLKDFDGNAITSRPKAFFVSQMMNYGVGNRTVAGIFRNKKLDAIAMYGYMPTKQLQNVTQIKFTDVKTGEVKYAPINKDKTNNVFYYEKQGDPSSKVTIEDLGYSSWISDYAIMAKYRDTLLVPLHKYYVDFANDKGETAYVNENGEVVFGEANKNLARLFTIGDLSQISENGKDPAQSPSVLAAEKTEPNDDAEPTKTGRSILSIDFQFNITG